MTTLEALLELQEVDGRIREFEKELKDLPQRKAKEEARLTGVRTDLEAARKGHDYAVQRVKEYEDDAAALKDKIRDLKQTQAGLQTNKEYQQYSTQIDLVNHDLETTENNQLAAMDDLPSAEARINEAQKKFDSEKSGVDSYCAEIDARIKEVETELEAARKERVEKAAAVTDRRGCFTMSAFAPSGGRSSWLSRTKACATGVIWCSRRAWRRMWTPT